MSSHLKETLKVLVAQSCLTLCNPKDCSLPGSSVHGILQAGDWSGLPFLSPGDLPNPGIESGSSALQADFFYHQRRPLLVLVGANFIQNSLLKESWASILNFQSCGQGLQVGLAGYQKKSFIRHQAVEELAHCLGSCF